MQRTGIHPFIGRFYHALEQKGRLSIPAGFRRQLGESAVITRGLDGCLFLFPPKQWSQLVIEAAQLPLTQRHARDWQRLLANNAAPVTFDALGRILVPEHLRQSASLVHQVVIVGSVSHIEIWDQETYHHYLNQIEPRAEMIAEALTSPASRPALHGSSK